MDELHALAGFKRIQPRAASSRENRVMANKTIVVEGMCVKDEH
jgi:hypothetical protein